MRSAMIAMVTVMGLMLSAAGAHAAFANVVAPEGGPKFSGGGIKKPGATTTSAEPFDEAQAADIARIEAYLSGIASLVSDFTQTSSDGSVGSGKFFLKRPGKMRWQYNPPTPILLISNGKRVTYYDPGLDQVTYIGADEVLAGFLASPTIQLTSDTTRITHLSKENGVMSVTIIQRKKPDDGSLTLEFTESPLAIARIIGVDATGNETHVTLEKLQFGPVLDDKLFFFNDPRGVNRKRNR